MGTVICSKCGIEFGVPDHWLKSRRDDKSVFYCPNGHPQMFGESESDRLRRERDQLKQRIAQQNDEIKAQRENRQIAERRVAAAKGQITKLKKRAKAGTCPCCNRTFSNMAAHMRSQHPEFDHSVVDFEVERIKRG